MHTDKLPLTFPMFAILASLANGSKHGYAILKEVEETTHGKIRFSFATLYETLAQLQEAELIKLSAITKRQKRYSITPKGAILLEKHWRIIQKIGALIPRKSRTK